MPRPAVLALAALLAVTSVGCPPRHVEPPPVVVDTHGPQYLEIARAEVSRFVGTPRLYELSEHQDPGVREAALRGMGRIGDAAALTNLRERVRTDRDAVVAAAALGIAGALDSVEEVDAAAITTELVALHGRLSDDGDRATVIEALGRVGDLSALPAITAALGGDDPLTAAAAGIALGRFGRRTLAVDEAAVRAAVARSADPDREIRYAATYALFRGYLPPADGAVAPAAAEAAMALAGRLRDDDPEIRALALAGLTRRTARSAAGIVAMRALSDPDWRVAVEAVRLLAAPGASVDDARVVAVHTAREWARLATGDASLPTAHPIMEALRMLTAHVADPQVRAAVDGIARSLVERLPAERPAELRLAASHIRALAFAALAVPGGEATYSPEAALVILEGTTDLPEEVIGALIAEGFAARLDTDRNAAEDLVERAGDDRTAGRRAAALGQLLTAWPKASAEIRPRLVMALVDGVIDDRTEVVGTAADAAAALINTLREPSPPESPPGDAAASDGYIKTLEGALLARLSSATEDAELWSSLLAAVAAAKLPSATSECERAYANVNPSVSKAGRDCLTTLTGTDPGPVAPPSDAASPDLADPEAVLGTAVTWTVETTRGPVTMELDPATAPWHVATIVALTRRGFYDGLSYHRVVPGFVVQGGDPDGTGWGGPGFTLPAEPSLRRYDTGTIGIADAGKDTGGSQWFVMHAAAPHLAARYTVIGAVTAGHEVIDRLLVGDRIVRATVEVQRRK